MATIAGGDAHAHGPAPAAEGQALLARRDPGRGHRARSSRSRRRAPIIGRSGADINIDDPEASRQHAALEIVGDVAILRDLGSTNGTWIELDRDRAARSSSNQQEFRIGSHVLMFIVTDVE